MPGVPPSPSAGVPLRRAVGARQELGRSVGRSPAPTGWGGAFGLGLPVSNQRAALAITRDYKWELYSIKIDSRVN